MPGTGKVYVNNRDLLEYFHYNPRCEFYFYLANFIKQFF